MKSKNIIYLLFFLIVTLVPAYHAELKNLENNSKRFATKGFISKKIRPFDKTITKYLKKRGFNGAILAISYNGKVIANKAYGWSDKEKKVVMQPNYMMKIASLSKILTTIAIKQLLENGDISFETKVFDYLKNFPDIKDSRIKNITVNHLLNHIAGWDHQSDYDPLFFIHFIAEDLKKKYQQLTQEDIIKYALKNDSLSFDPGNKVSYSNLGFLILGKIIEKASNISFLKYINKNIAKRISVKFYLGKTNESLPNEILWYQINGPIEEDTYLIEISGSAFGLVTSAQDLCKLLENYWIDGDKRNKDQKRQYSMIGSLPGITTLARQRYSGANIVVFINSRDDNNWENDAIILKNLIDNIANKCGL